MDKNVISIEEVRPMESKGDDFYNCYCKFLISKETMNTDACMFRATFLPGGYHAPHLHTKSDEYFYVISCGKAITCIENKIYEMKSGMCFYFPKKVIHWTKNIDNTEKLELVTCYPNSGNIEESGYEYFGDKIPEKYI
jgi:mannose-6-phosphate isomerase-like protein (cupin superfamily)